MDKITIAISLMLIAFGLAVGLGALFAFPVEWLWNGVVTDIFPSVHQIGFLQAWGLLILCSLLFKSTNINNSSNK